MNTWYNSETLIEEVAKLRRPNRYPNTKDNTADALQLMQLQLAENGWPPHKRIVSEKGEHHKLSDHNIEVYHMPMDFQKGVFRWNNNGKWFYGKFFIPHWNKEETILEF